MESSFTPPLASASGQKPPRHFKVKKWEIAAGIFAVLAVAGLIYLGIFEKKEIFKQGQYAEVFALVNDKISQSAAIVVNLPKGVKINPAEAKDKILFEPKIDGDWIASLVGDKFVFKPKSKLEVGKYYSVVLAAADINIKKDFLADEDPKIEAILPAKDSEAPENSEITIIFNRPMAPLTALDALAEKDIPVEIIPQTSGKFKWSTTRNLQFIPEKRLLRSSNYTVRVKSGFVSMDGLSVPEAIHNFTTRILRYEEGGVNYGIIKPILDYANPALMIYNQPIRVYFNQPFDLERTRAEISVNKIADGRNIDFISQYGARSVYDQEAKKYKKFIDKSILEIYSAKDRFGREKLWDFDTQYGYAIKKSYPLEGDIIINQQRNGTIKTTEIIQSITAESERSKYVDSGFFDPKGKLWITLYEDVDKNATAIRAGNLIKEIGYGEKCKIDKETGEITYFRGNECEKETDYKKIYIKFDEGALKAGDAINLEFKKVVNKDGLQINAEEFSRTISVYQGLRITKTAPKSGDIGASVSELKICSNNPLEIATEENFYERIKGNLSIGKFNWFAPRRIGTGDESICATGEFENIIRYGLIPESQYKLTLNLVDDFGQTANAEIEFITGEVPEISRRIYNFQKIYNVASPEKTKLTFAAENLEYVNMHICEASAETMLSYAKHWPDPGFAPSSLNCVNSSSKIIDLPQKYWTKNYFQVNLKDYIEKEDIAGYYIVSLGHPKYRQMQWRWDPKGNRSFAIVGKQIYERVYINITRLAAQEKRLNWRADENYGGDVSFENLKSSVSDRWQNLYWVSEFNTLAPVANAKISLYQRKNQRRDSELIKAKSYLTDEKGIAKTEAIPNLAAAIIAKGSDSTIVSEYTDKLRWASPAYSASRNYIYTDRPIYRPGQEVFIKGIYRIGYDGNYEIFRDKKINLEVFNSKGESMFKKDLDVNEYGTYNASFVLDSQAALGTYRIEAQGSDMSWFDVEEYVPSPFKVEVKPDKEEYIAGDLLKFDIDANYYFGAPVDFGKVEYTIMSQDYYFDRYSDGYFNFGGGWYYDYAAPYGDRFILRGKAELDKSGKARIEQMLDFKKFFKDEDAQKSKIFIVQLTVKNQNGQSVSAEKSLIVHRGEFYLGVDLDKTFLAKKEPFSVKVKSVNTEGKAISIQNISLEINKIKWEYFKRQEVDGGYYYQSAKKKELIAKINISTDGNGDFSKEFQVEQEGEYEASVSSVDGRGNPIVASRDFYVYGPKETVIRPTNNEELELVTEKSKLEAGERAKIIIKSPYVKAKALISIERGKIFDYEIIDVNRNLVDYNFIIKESYIPNIYVSVLLLSDGPEIKYGQIQYAINTKQREIKTFLKTDKTDYLPGEEVRLDIETRDFENKPIAAELSLAVVDASVLALKGNQKKNPLLFFYQGLPLTVQTFSNIKNILYEVEIPSGTKGGGGAEAPQDLAKKKRGEFKDTAYWNAIVATGSDGKASISFRLPDNLTTWQIESIGVTKDTKLGAGYQEFTVNKNIMVVPLRPRFIIPGDEFLLGAQVFNETDADQNLKVSLESGTLEIKGAKEQPLNLKSEENKTVYVSVKAPINIEDGNHKFIFSAKNDNFEDTVEQSIPINRNNTYEAASTAYYTAENAAKEYVYIPDNIVKDRGGIAVKTNATLAVFLSDALNYLVSYPYGCSEQIASKLSSIAIVKRGLSLKNIGDKFNLKSVKFEDKEYSIDDLVKIGLSRIYGSQNYGGGFSYYSHMEPNFYLTLHIVNVLKDLELAGYDINKSVLDKAARYLAETIVQDRRFNQDKDLVILTVYAMSRFPQYGNNNTMLFNLVSKILSDEKFIKEDISNVSLTHLAMLLTKGNYSQDAKNRIYKILENRIDVDARGAFLGINKNYRLIDYYEAPLKNTALLLKSFVADKRDNPVIDKVLRWILRSRGKDGAWDSSNNTLAVVDAFTDFLEWKRETESDFELKLLLDKSDIAKFDFNKDTILQTFEKFISLGDLKFGEMSVLEFVKTNRNKAANNFYYDMSFKYFLPIDAIPPRDEGFGIKRQFYATDDKDNKTPLAKAKVGDVLKEHLTIFVPNYRNFISVEDFIPAGMEIVNLRLATENQSLRKQPEYYDGYGGGRGEINPQGGSRALASPKNKWNFDISFLPDNINKSLKNMFALALPSFDVISEDLADEEYLPKESRHNYLYPDMEELHDDRAFLFKERLSPGVYEYDYYVRALIPGKYHHLPAVASEMYFPENFGRTGGGYFEILPQ